MNDIKRWVQVQMRQYDFLMRLQGFPPVVRTGLQLLMLLAMILVVLGVVVLLLRAWWLALLVALAWWWLKRPAR
jgi:hypothetical protein